MSRGAETIQPQSLSGPDLAQAKRPIADDSGAEEGGGFLIGEDLRNGVGELLWNDGISAYPPSA